MSGLHGDDDLNELHRLGSHQIHRRAAAAAAGEIVMIPHRLRFLLFSFLSKIEIGGATNLGLGFLWVEKSPDRFQGLLSAI